MNTKRNIFLWTLYDFANSLVQIVFFLYFAQWIVIDRGMEDIYFNLTFTFSAVLLLLTAPLVGILLDSHMRRITGLRYSTLAVTVLYGLCAFFAVMELEIHAIILFTLGLYAYLLTFTFYTPLINDIARPEKRGFVSGLGIAGNYIGQFVGLLIVLPFSTGKLSLFGSSARAETLLPAVIIFTVCALPMLLWFYEPKRDAVKMSLGQGLKELSAQTKKLFAVPGLAMFLLAYFLFNDTILTASNNFPIFLQQVWGVPDTIKTYVLMGIIVTSGIGGLASGIIADRVGHKRTLMYIVGGWMVILPLLAFVQNFILFVVVAVIMGFWFGSHWSVSRSLMADIAPRKGGNLAFTYFGLVERTSSFVGPVFWGLSVRALSEMGSHKYRVTVALLTLFMVAGFLALTKVSNRKTEEEAQL